MIPRPATAAEAAYWSRRDRSPEHAVVMGGLEEGADVIPCPALVAPAAAVIHVAYALDELEVADLAHGGTLWLTTHGGLPVHLVEVIR